jgi:hypothetical protein
MGQYCFAPKVLKHRTYYNNYELGHRYLLNLRRNESYTRYASARGETADFYLPLGDGKSPQELGTFGNGEWVFEPVLTDANWLEEFDFAANVCETSEGLKAVDPSRPAVIIFRVDGANIITSALARFDLKEARPNETCAISVSTDLGHSWRELLKSSFYAGGPNEVALDGVRGTHQYLVRIELTGGAILSRLFVRTITQLNKLTLPVLDLGLNTIDVVSGDPTETVMLWPELQHNRFLETCQSSENIASGKAEEWHGCLWLKKPGTGNLVYAIDTPGEVTELMYGGRFYNRAPKSSIAIEHSTDEGKTWTKAWELTDTGQPWDTVHFETVKVPAGTKRVLVRYRLNSSSAGRYEGCSVYSIRANATYKPANAKFEPFVVHYNWGEWSDKDGKWIERGHRQLITQPRQRYTISVGGDDLPRTNWIMVCAETPPGHALEWQKTHPSSSIAAPMDGIDLKAKPFARTRHVWGKNLAEGKKYTFSVPSGKNWNGGDPAMTKLTDQAIAPTYGGGTTYMDGPIWETGKNPEITLDLGQPQSIAATRIHATGYPYDFYNGPFSEIEVLTSEDGQAFVSQKKFPTRMRFKDVDGDFVMPECGRFESWTFPVVFEKPVKARYVRFKIENPKMVFDTSELMVYDSVKIENWNEPLAMPLDR